MLTVGRSLSQSSRNGKPMPYIPDLADLYSRGLRLREGQVVMISGRSGSGKSLLAMWLCLQWNAPTLYFSADMSESTAANRVASSITGETFEQIEQGMGIPEKRAEYMQALQGVRMTFSFRAPISWHKIETELDAYVELWDAYPKVIVIDNLKEMDGAESEYQAQMEAMAGLTDLARATGSMVIVLHHASDKTFDASHQPFRPPSRNEIKNGLSENPEVSLSVALDSTKREFHIAIIKQRDGWQDPTARYWDSLRSDAARARFHRMGGVESSDIEAGSLG